MTKTQLLEQPDAKQQKLLDDIVEDGKTIVKLAGPRKKSYKISWLKRGAQRKISAIMNGKDSDKNTCKIAACIVLNGYWAIKFRYWFLWRWFYYVRQYSDHELQPLLDEGKKKVPVEAYFETTILAIGMKDTMMAMTRAEVERILQEHSTDQLTP